MAARGADRDKDALRRSRRMIWGGELKMLKVLEDGEVEFRNVAVMFYHV
jgi:hypothetical protein